MSWTAVRSGMSAASNCFCDGEAEAEAEMCFAVGRARASGSPQNVLGLGVFAVPLQRLAERQHGVDGARIEH